MRLAFDPAPPPSRSSTLRMNIARNANGQFAYITVGGLNEIQVSRTDDFTKVATIPVGRLQQQASNRSTPTCWRSPRIPTASASSTPWPAS